MLLAVGGPTSGERPVVGLEATVTRRQGRGGVSGEQAIAKGRNERGAEEACENTEEKEQKWCGSFGPRLAACDSRLNQTVRQAERVFSASKSPRESSESRLWTRYTATPLPQECRRAGPLRSSRYADPMRVYTRASSSSFFVAFLRRFCMFDRGRPTVSVPFATFLPASVRIRRRERVSFTGEPKDRRWCTPGGEKKHVALRPVVMSSIVSCRFVCTLYIRRVLFLKGTAVSYECCLPRRHRRYRG